MQNINPIVNLNRRSPEVKEFIDNILIPGISKFLDDDIHAIEFISYFHSLGICAEFVLDLLDSNKNLKTAINSAIEKCIFRSLQNSFTHKDNVQHINYLKSLFYIGTKAPKKDTIVVFKPHDMSREDALVAMDIELKKREEQNNLEEQNDLEEQNNLLT